MSGPRTPASDLRDLRAKNRQLVRDADALRKRVADLEVELATARAPANDDDKEDVLMEDLGTEQYQDTWRMNGASRVLELSMHGTRIACPSVENDHGAASMPGVRCEKALTIGRYFQTIYFVGSGYTLCGLVTEAQSLHLPHVSNNFNVCPYMTPCDITGHSRSGMSVSIMVDMVTRTGSLHQDGRELASWKDPPDRVYVAIAFKRNTAREAILMPAMHTKTVEIETIE